MLNGELFVGAVYLAGLLSFFFSLYFSAITGLSRNVE